MGLAGGAPSEIPHRATGPIHFFAPDFGVAAARGLVVEEFVDTGVSGAQSSGPARNKLLEAAQLRQIDLVPGPLGTLAQGTLVIAGGRSVGQYYQR